MHKFAVALAGCAAFAASAVEQDNFEIFNVGQLQTFLQTVEAEFHANQTNENYFPPDFETRANISRYGIQHTVWVLVEPEVTRNLEQFRIYGFEPVDPTSVINHARTIFPNSIGTFSDTQQDELALYTADRLSEVGRVINDIRRYNPAFSDRTGREIVDTLAQEMRGDPFGMPGMDANHIDSFKARIDRAVDAVEAKARQLFPKPKFRVAENKRWQVYKAVRDQLNEYGTAPRDLPAQFRIPGTQTVDPEIFVENMFQFRIGFYDAVNETNDNEHDDNDNEHDDNDNDAIRAL